MVKPKKKEAGLGRTNRSLSDALNVAEDRALMALKFLQQQQSRRKRAAKASVRDAVLLARTIAALAAFGRRQDAEQAIVIATKVELLLDCLVREMDAL